LKRGNTEQHIIDGVKTYASSSDVTRGYAKGCAAWLNDDGFNNDYKPVGYRTEVLPEAIAVSMHSLMRQQKFRKAWITKPNSSDEKTQFFTFHLAAQSGGTDYIAGSLEAPDAAKSDATFTGIGSDKEGGTDGHEQ
jgi:hypothetical protein